MDVSDEEPMIRIKRARFPQDTTKLAVVLAYLPSLSEFTEQDVKRIWFDEEAFNIFKATARQIAMQANRFRLDGLIDWEYEGQQDKDPLLKWARHGHCRRGLEQWVKPSHGERQLYHKRKTIESVLHSQKVMRALNADQDLINEELANISMKHSVHSILFAQRLGIADAEAARDINVIPLHGVTVQRFFTYIQRMPNDDHESLMKGYGGEPRIAPICYHIVLKPLESSGCTNATA